MSEMNSRQRNALQAGVGVAILGVALIALAIYNLAQLNSVGDARDDAEGITLAALQQRGRKGNTHVRILEFSFTQQYVAWTVTTKSRSGSSYTDWKYVVLPVYPNDAPAPANALAAVVWTNSVNSDIQVNRWIQGTTSVRGMLRPAKDLLTEGTIADLKRTHPATDFDTLLVLEAGASPPWRYWGWAFAAAVLAFLASGAIFYFNFRAGATSKPRKRKRPRPVRKKDRDEDPEDEEDEEDDRPRRRVRHEDDEDDRLRRRRE
jgi:hypothetical protein